jgi:lysophospholipase L1-like esterase
MRIFVFLSFLISISSSLFGQDPLRFEKEVANLVASDSAVSSRKLILFTGSSSIRIWKSLKSDLPTYNTLNRGFGGSEMTDLLHYADQLIIQYNPKEIFIYEGDNDLNSGKEVSDILKTADQLLIIIRERLPKNVKVFFISAKPSVARWALKEKYLNYNKQLEAWTKTAKKVYFVDVWKPLLDAQGEVLKDIYIADGLHLNEQGYKIWAGVIKNYL